MKKILFSLIAVSAFAVGARADIIPTLSSISNNANGTFTWNYDAQVTLNQQVQAGDFFTIYDFGNIVPGSNTQPAGWTFSSSLVGKTPPLVNATDNPSLLNLTWTYAGNETFTGPLDLGIFSVQTTTSGTRTGQFAAEATRSTGPQVGTKIDNIGSVTVPVPEMSALMPILGVCGMGVAGLATSLWRRRQVG